MRTKVILAAFFCCLSSSAFAFWDVQNSGEDVFGNVNVTATSIGDNGNILRFECGSSSEPFLAFLIRDNSGEIPDIPAVFVHQSHDGERYEVTASMTSWNEKYIAVKVMGSAAL